MDETARVEAEHLARAQESRLLMAAAVAGLGLSDWTTTAPPYLDARLQDIPGIGPEESGNAQLLWLSRIHEDDRPALAEDIPALIRTFVEELTRSMGKRIEQIDARSLDALADYSWPGNVRAVMRAGRDAVQGSPWRSDRVLRTRLARS
jgi:hypothetical protein